MRDTGRTQTFAPSTAGPRLPLRWGAAAPLTVEQRVLAALVVLCGTDPRPLVRATREGATLGPPVHLELSRTRPTRTG
ncbi:hypothetical protein GCM10017687_81040 [Streptomyces echinatus]|uniref:hypothetical protein n=1 Tax=Streptomyces echinatus TaxID=67293 RepID=UPI0031EC9E4A